MNAFEKFRYYAGSLLLLPLAGLLYLLRKYERWASDTDEYGNNKE